MIPALVLTAGLGTRLRPLSFVRAKPALPVAGDPLIRRILVWLAGSGVTDAVLNLHHLPDTITRIVGDGSDVGLRVRYSWESPVLGSAGGPRHALPLLETTMSARAQGTASPFLIVNGDTLTDLNLDALVAAHRGSGALVTMAVVPNTDPAKYGGVRVEDGIVTGFVKRGTAEPSYHFIGVQVAEGDAFRALPDGVPAESTGSVYPSLIDARPAAVRAHVTSAAFFDIGTPADYLESSLTIGRREGRTVWQGERCRIDATATVSDSILWDDVEVGPGVLLRECVVADGAHVPGDTAWHGVTIRPAQPPFAPGEKPVGGLAICSL